MSPVNGRLNATSQPPSTCRLVQANGETCGRPEKGRLHPGNTPVCGIHLRAAQMRGEETR